MRKAPARGMRVGVSGNNCDNTASRRDSRTASLVFRTSVAAALVVGVVATRSVPAAGSMKVGSIAAIVAADDCRRRQMHRLRMSKF